MFKKEWKKYMIPLFCFLLILSLTGCENKKKDSAPLHTNTAKINFSEKDKEEQKAFEAFVKQEFEETVTTNTLVLHSSLKDPEGFGIKRPKATFGDIDLEHLEDDGRQLRKTQKKLHTIDRSSLTKEQGLLYDILDYYLDTGIKMSKYSLYGNPFSANTGLSTELPITMAQYAFYNEQDVKDYLSLMNQIPSFFESYIKICKKQKEEGLFMADFAVDNTISQIDIFLNEKENTFITSFNEKIEEVSFLSDDQKKSYQKNNELLVREKVLFAYQTLKNELAKLKSNAQNGEGNLKGNVTKEGGVCHQKNGKEYYEALVQYQTGSNKTPSEWIELFENRISFLMVELQRIARRTPSAFEAVYSLSFDNTDLEKILEQLKKDMKDDFPEISDIDYSVTKIPKSLQNSTTAAFYMIPPLDDLTQNNICVNEANISSASPLLPTLAHEGYPGHLYQTNYFREHNNYPIRQLISFIGYSEGWGFYVENFSYRYLNFGSYHNVKDEVCRIYEINNELNYLIASLADLYVNYEGYSREELQNYLEAYRLSSENSDKIFETVAQDPTIYLKYYAGYTELVNLKTKCEEKLGKGFDLQAFHRIILDAGPCPFPLLEQKIDEYLAENAK